MTDNAASDWAFPVRFYFMVEFQSKLDRFQTSFTEVSGLDMRVETIKKTSDTGIWITMPGGVQYGKITLKRPIPPDNNDTFTQWIYKCLKADTNKKMIAYDMIIKLLNKEGNPLAGWICSYAYPLQWTLDSLNSEDSKLVTETVIMACNRIDRLKI
ncbi:phage tail protein [Parabacteroides gordonii]|jgi:phage tail-like protein|uniref:phage tail protein n=1 Tax=Parabacteroides gordonii TaxID=574930 RepID=UPI0026ED10CA|nr:phage tail protein [Parabacteroides gordonii]